jgi:hypothetical protein
MPRPWSFGLVRKCVAIAACWAAMPFLVLFFLMNGWVEGLPDGPEAPVGRAWPRRVSAAMWLAADEAHVGSGVEPLSPWGLFHARRSPGFWAADRVARLWLVDHDRSRTLQRIGKEWSLTWWLTRRWSEEELADWTAMHLYFGHGARGLPGAAWLNFEKRVDDLTWGELAYLAGAVQMPERFGPSQPEKSRKRRDFILRRFAEEKLITPEELKTELSRELVFRAWPPAASTPN